MNTDILMNGSMVKNHISSKTGFGYLAIRRTSFLLLYQACQVHPLDLHRPQRHLQNRRAILRHLLRARLLHQLQQHHAALILETEDQSEIDSPPVPVSSSNVDDTTEKPVVCRETNYEQPQANQKFPKTNKKETTIERRNLLFADSGRAPSSSEIPEWLQEFRENLVDDEIPEHGDSHASSFHEVSLEPTCKRREELGKHSVYTHSLKTEIARSVRGPK